MFTAIKVIKRIKQLMINTNEYENYLNQFYKEKGIDKNSIDYTREDIDKLKQEFSKWLAETITKEIKK